MSGTAQKFRREIIQASIGFVISATRLLPIGLQLSAVRRLVALGGSMPFARARVRANMRLGLGDDIPPDAEIRYFRHVAWFQSNSLATFHHGLAATPVIDDVRFDDTISVLDEAFAQGRGVVLTSPHWTGHELVGAAIGRRHPLVMLVREAPASARAARKAKWYAALGVETVIRPNKASAAKDAVAYLKVLRSGRMLGITPDILAHPGKGVEVSLFGRRPELQAGAFRLAISTGAPMIRISWVWQPDSGLLVTFERAPQPSLASDPAAAVQASVQDWCHWFEDKLRANPENWLFWLDKRWSRFLREPPMENAP